MISSLVVAVNLSLTTGALCTLDHKDFKKLRYEEQIPTCKRNVSYSLKTSLYKAYGIDLKYRKDYTIDHFIPLSLGGDNSYENLWPQHKSIHTGDCEGKIFRQVDNGNMSIARAHDILYDVKINGKYCYSE